MIKNLRRDLDVLLNDIETYIVERQQSQFINPLRYRLGLLQEKFEHLSPVFFGSGSDTQKIEEDLRFANAILN